MKKLLIALLAALSLSAYSEVDPIAGKRLDDIQNGKNTRNAIKTLLVTGSGDIGGTLTVGGLAVDTNMSVVGITATGTVQGEQLTSTDDATVYDSLTVNTNINAKTASLTGAVGIGGRLTASFLTLSNAPTLVASSISNTAIAADAVTGDKISDGTLSNADISATAAIDAAKIDPATDLSINEAFFSGACNFSNDVTVGGQMDVGAALGVGGAIEVGGNITLENGEYIDNSIDSAVGIVYDDPGENLGTFGYSSTATNYDNQTFNLVAFVAKTETNSIGYFDERITILDNTDDTEDSQVGFWIRSNHTAIEQFLIGIDGIQTPGALNVAGNITASNDVDISDSLTVGSAFNAGSLLTTYAPLVLRSTTSTTVSDGDELASHWPSYVISCAAGQAVGHSTVTVAGATSIGQIMCIYSTGTGLVTIADSATMDLQGVDWVGLTNDCLVLFSTATNEWAKMFSRP